MTGCGPRDLLDLVDRRCAGGPRAHSVLAPLEAPENGSPLEVKERERHDREADVDCDDHGPVGVHAGLGCLRDQRKLNFEARADNRAFCAPVHDVYFVSAAVS